MEVSSSSHLFFLAASRPERVDGDWLLLLDLLEEVLSTSLVMVNVGLLGLLDREGDLAASPERVDGDLLFRLLDREGDLGASPETVDGALLL